MKYRSRIIIAGGGIGGFTAALSLLKKGFAVHLLEKAPQLGEVGAGLQNSPNSVRVLHALGLGPDYERTCFTPKARELRMWDSGIGPKRPTSNAELVGKYGFSHINMHRADLHQALVDAVKREPGCTIQLGAEYTGFEQDDDGVTVTLSSGEQIRGEALIGADGIHSRARQQLFGLSQARFTGAVIWRGLIPLERLPEAMRDRNGETWIGPDGHISLYPVRRGELINFVGHLDRDEWKEDSWIVPGDTAELASDFSGWHEEIQTFIRNIDKPTKWGLFVHDTLPQWSVGRVTLLGDACHPMLPYLGQGANMAIEDGFVLARCLDAFPGDIPAGLRSYDTARIARTTRVVNMSADNVKYFRTPAFDSTDEARDWLSNAWDAQMDLRDWIFSYDATSVSIAEQDGVAA